MKKKSSDSDKKDKVEDKKDDIRKHPDFVNVYKEIGVKFLTKFGVKSTTELKQLVDAGRVSLEQGEENSEEKKDKKQEVVKVKDKSKDKDNEQDKEIDQSKDKELIRMKKIMSEHESQISKYKEVMLDTKLKEVYLLSGGLPNTDKNKFADNAVLLMRASKDFSVNDEYELETEAGLPPDSLVKTWLQNNPNFLNNKSIKGPVPPKKYSLPDGKNNANSNWIIAKKFLA